MTNETGVAKADAAKGRAWLLAGVVVVMLAGLPLAVWLDLTALAKTSLNRQAADLSSVVSSIRSYYASNVVGRVLAGDGSTKVAHNYETIPGAIPIPATLSLELGRVIAEKQANITYRFVSDLPFKGRAVHPMDAFEQGALAQLRADPEAIATDFSWRGLDDSFRLVTPVIMGAACVKCHNSHPDSPKTDWKVGDVRGIQEIIITQSLAASIFAFKYLLAYFIFVGAAGLAFILLQRQQARTIRGINRDLESANAFLASVSMKISRYLSPQIYKSIFSGQRDVVVHTERKRLTIFFSDIKDFTATAERLQPEALTHMLNEYLTEMSVIAQRHGGTLDKFIGDAVLVFFGDPETKGAAEDARACLNMAIDMQRRLDELKSKWRLEGTEEPFIVRMGINTGFCNVGNFGSNDRMDYTIIGAEANLAARLQSIAQAGQIVLSYETYALTQDLIRARPLPPITMKGIAREIVPYVVDGLREGSAPVVHEQLAGLDLHLDLTRVTDTAKARSALEAALEALQNQPSRY